MKPMSFFYAGLLFAAVIICGTGFYGGLVSDYADMNASMKINTTGLHHKEIYESTDAIAVNASAEMEEGMKGAVQDIPIIGGIAVQVFSAYQVVKSFILSLWDGLTIGTMLLTDLNYLLPAPWKIPTEIVRLIQISIIMMFIGSIIYLLLHRRT